MEYYIREILLKVYESNKINNDLASNELVILFTDKAEEYSKFCVMCDREGLGIISFKDYLKLCKEKT